MALDSKLKLEMAGGATCPDQVKAEPVPDYTENRPRLESCTQEAGVDDGKFPSNPYPVEQSVTQEEALLRSIEKQLMSLNQSVADLEQEVNTYKSPDYRAVFSKIDSARYSLEKMFSEAGSIQRPSSDSCSAEKIARLEELVAAVIEKQDRNDRQLAQTLRENANFQIQVRQGMQKDIDALKEQQSGEQFNPILREIASMCVEYQSLLEDESISDLSQKNLKALFEQMEDLLTDYGAEITRSEIGDIRQTRITKIVEKIPVGNQNRHNTIAKSRKPGVLKGRTVLYPELVDVFVYDPMIIPEEGSDETPTGSEENQDKNFSGNEAIDSVIPSDSNAAHEPVRMCGTESTGATENEKITAESTEQTKR